MQKNLFQKIGSAIMLSVMSIASCMQLAPVVTYAAESNSNEKVVKITGSKNGTVSFFDDDSSSKKFKVDEKVNLKVQPKDGYIVSKIIAVTPDKDVVTTNYQNDAVNFIMPNSDVKIYSEFVKSDITIRGPTSMGDLSYIGDEGVLKFDKEGYSIGDKVSFKLLKQGKLGLFDFTLINSKGEKVETSFDKDESEYSFELKDKTTLNVFTKPWEDLLPNANAKKVDVDTDVTNNFSRNDAMGYFQVDTYVHGVNNLKEFTEATQIDPSKIENFDQEKFLNTFHGQTQRLGSMRVSEDNSEYVINVTDPADVLDYFVTFNNAAAYNLMSYVKSYDKEKGVLTLDAKGIKAKFDELGDSDYTKLDGVFPIKIQFVRKSEKMDEKKKAHVYVYNNFSDEKADKKYDIDMLPIEGGMIIDLGLSNFDNHKDAVIAINGIILEPTSYIIDDGKLILIDQNLVFTGNIQVYLADKGIFKDNDVANFIDEYSKGDSVFAKLFSSMTVYAAPNPADKGPSDHRNALSWAEPSFYIDMTGMNWESLTTPLQGENRTLTHINGYVPDCIQLGTDWINSTYVPTGQVKLSTGQGTRQKIHQPDTYHTWWIRGDNVSERTAAGNLTRFMVDTPWNESYASSFNSWFDLINKNTDAKNAMYIRVNGDTNIGVSLESTYVSISDGAIGVTGRGTGRPRAVGSANLGLHCMHGETRWQTKPGVVSIIPLRALDSEPDANGFQNAIVVYYTPTGEGNQQGWGLGRLRFRFKSSGDYKVRKSFEHMPGSYYKETATFRMTPININGQDVVEKSITGDGEVLFEDLKPGEYTLSEVSVGRGYEVMEPQTVTVTAGLKADAAPVTNVQNVAKRGELGIHKVSKKKAIDQNNKNYSKAGAKYEASLADSDVVYTLITDESGAASVGEIPLGDYTLKEIEAPKGFAVEAESDTVSVVTSNLQTRVQDHPRFDPISIELFKRDKELTDIDPSREHAQGDMSMADAVFRVDYYVEQTLTKEQIKAGQGTKKFSVDLTTKEENGRFVTYMMREYMSNFNHVDGTSFDDMFVMEKGHEIFAIPYGTITLTETKAPIGYEKDGLNIKTRDSDHGGMYVRNIVDTTTGRNNDTNIMVDQPTNFEGKAYELFDSSVLGSIRVAKHDNQTNNVTPQGDAKLKASFDVINRSKNAIVYKGKIYEPSQVIDRITTDDDTRIATITDLKIGTYEIVEVETDSTYNLVPYTKTVKITANDRNIDLTGNVQNQADSAAANKVKRGGVKVRKVDSQLKEDGKPQGDATLKGAEFTIVNKSKEAVYNLQTNEKYDVDAVVAVITTGKDGVASSDIGTLPIGTYEIRETKAPEGYLLNTEWVHTFTIREENVGRFVEFMDIRSDKPAVKDDVIRGDVQVQKWDKELAKSEAIAGFEHNGANGEATQLNGITFEIKNISKEKVVVDDKIYLPGEVVKKITTHWNDELKAYTAETTDRTLPYGTYEIREVETNESYLLTDETVHTFEIREDGVTVTTNKKDQLMKYENQVKRGDFEFVKIVDGTSERLSTLWTLTNVHSGEVHVIATDKNGEFYSSVDDGYNHTHKTNANDGLLEKIKAEESIDMADVVMDSGVWFGLGEDGSMADANDDLRALPFGKYELAEVRTDTNEGLSLQKFTFYVYRDNKVVNGGTVTNDRIPPEVETEALDKETEDHVGSSIGKRIIVDKVSYKNLRKGKEYTVKGFLMNKDTNSPLIIDGKRVEAEKKFTAEKSNGFVELEFVIDDGSKLAGLSTVAFEDLFEGDLKVATHADITDEGQTVHYPKVKTTATNKATGTHTAPAKAEQVIVDKVAYSKLTPGKTYKMSGQLMIKQTGEKFGSVVEKEFTPESPDGFVELEFTVDLSELAGKSVVAFETLSKDGVDITVHADLEDEDQTVEIPKIGTKASDMKTQTNQLSLDEVRVIVDKVSYTNLRAGETYTVSGTLMDKKTEKPFMIDGKEVTATKEFVAEANDGFVELEFEVRSVDLRGESLVAFEKVSQGDIELAVHADINDKDQSVHGAKIGTTATGEDGKSKEVEVGEDIVIKDTVSYENLVVGEKVKVVGMIYSKQTGEPFLDSEKNPITSEVEFTPEESNGSIVVEFKINTKDLQGQDLVVFEDMYSSNGSLIGQHHDINDEGQTVKVKTEPKKPPKEPNSDKPNTGVATPIGVLTIIMMMVFAVGFGFVYVSKKR